MKKFKVLIIAIFILFLASGCAKAILRLDIYKDGSADMSYTVLIDNQARGMIASIGEDPFVELRAEAEEEGFALEDTEIENMSGFVATKHLETLEGAFQNLAIGENIGAKDERAFDVEKGFFKTTYSINQELDLSDIQNLLSKEEAAMTSMMLSQIDLRFVLGLPIESIENNAGTVSEDGKVLEWKLIPGTKKNIVIKIEVWNVVNIILLIISILVVATLFYIIAKRKIKSREE